MIIIKKTPTYITRELCTDAGLTFDEEKICYAALNGRDICGFCVFEMHGQTAVVIYADAPNNEILDGVIRAAIAGGEEMGAVYYDFAVGDELAKRILPLGFRKSQGESAHSIAKLFTACTGCNK